MKLISILSLLMVFSLTACSSKKKDDSKVSEAKTMSEEQVGEITADWSPKHQEIIQQVVSKYGQPNESTSDTLIWNGNGPWVKTVLKKSEAKNPLEQTVSLDVPPEKMGDVALFNRNVVVNSTADEVTSSANREDLNFLAINLTKEIADGGMSPMEARRQYAQMTDVRRKSDYLQNLKFQESEEAMEAEEVR